MKMFIKTILKIIGIAIITFMQMCYVSFICNKDVTIWTNDCFKRDCTISIIIIILMLIPVIFYLYRIENSSRLLSSRRHEDFIRLRRFAFNSPIYVFLTIFLLGNLISLTCFILLYKDRLDDLLSMVFPFFGMIGILSLSIGFLLIRAQRHNLELTSEYKVDTIQLGIKFKIVFIILFSFAMLCSIFFGIFISDHFQAYDFLILGIINFILIIQPLLFLINHLLDSVQQVKNTLMNLIKSDTLSVEDIPVISNDETGELAEQLNTFLHTLRNIIFNIRSATMKSRIIGQNISTNSYEASLTLEKMNRNIDSIISTFNGLEDDINHSSHHVQQIVDEIVKLVNQINEQSSAIDEWTSSITTMIALIKNVANISDRQKESTQKLIEMTQDSVDKVDITSKAIKTTSENVQNIFSVLKIIDDIADKTNILAMNASIESSHAGNSGRGFSIVSKEIRKLAEDAAINSKRIGITLKDIVDKIKIVDSYSKESNEAITQVTQEVQEVVHTLEEITNTMTDISTEGSEILKAISNLFNVSEIVRQGALNMKNGANDMNQSIKHLREVSVQSINDINAISVWSNEVNDVIANFMDFGKLNRFSVEKLLGEINKLKIQ